MIYRNVVIGKPLVEPWELIAIDERDWEDNEREYTLFTETRYLPAVLKEVGLVSATREVRRNRPDLCRTFADDELDCLDIKLGKKKLWVVVGAGSEEAYRKIMDRIEQEYGVPRTTRDVFDELGDDEKEVVFAMVGCALEHGKVNFDILGDGARAIYYGFTDEQKKVAAALVREAGK